MAHCQLVKSLSWSSLPLALAFLFISIPTKCFLLYDKAKLRPIFALLGEQLLESKLDHSCHNAISLCITIACHQHQQSLLCQWEAGSRRIRINTMKWSINSSGMMKNTARYVWVCFFDFPQIFRLIRYMKGNRALCVNMWDVWWDVMVPPFTPFKSTIWCVAAKAFHSVVYERLSILSVTHFIIMENPLGTWVYIITSKLCTSDCFCHYDWAKNPIIPDMFVVCCNKKKGKYHFEYNLTFWMWLL